ncbi:MAG: ATP-dependent sacrificial sulfur transferase LarE [Chitinispirillia bacterium]|nr:ATP-dependent sacrificial sulfur transferase LarE [Chitinispirillia bacterium]
MINALEQFFRENPSAALGFSGGADSSYLLYAALRYGADVKAYFVKSAFQPNFEIDDAYKIIKQLKAQITVIEQDIFSDEQIISNPRDRCYHCKKVIFRAIQKQAAADGFTLVIDGTNFSDDAADRPGMKALTELGVRSPLRECGLTKSDVRRLSKEAGLFTWDKPAYACLATRVPHGRIIEKELLERIERSEEALFNLGFRDLRVRVIDEAAKLQFSIEQIDTAISKRREIVNAVKPCFNTVLLDLEGR